VIQAIRSLHCCGMGLFRRKDRAASRAEAIAEFWRWWAGARTQVAQAIASGTSPALASEIGDRVEAISAELEWELTPGLNARHALIVTAAGKAELRATTARWLAAAPPADEVWEYHAARVADPAVFDSKLGIGEASMDMGEIRYSFTVDEDRRQVDVTCYHPGFAGVPDQVRGQVTFLTLDWLLGALRREGDGQRHAPSPVNG
jgi:hypothetical protein